MNESSDSLKVKTLKARKKLKKIVNTVNPDLKMLTFKDLSLIFYKLGTFKYFSNPNFSLKN
jgi:hypothetical protein